MSAFVVGKKHIDTLVTGLIRAEMIREKDADDIGFILWNENQRSVNSRYNQDDLAPGYDYTPNEVKPEVLRAAISCYDYQSGEHDGWEASHAYALVHWLDQVLEGNGIDVDPNAWEIR